jgi:hypothetical protein
MTTTGIPDVARHAAKPSPRSRSSAEWHLYMDLRPCECGETDFGGSSAVGDGEHGLEAEYSGPCRRCGRPRSFTFLITEEPVLRLGYEWAPPDAGPSDLLDPGEWIAVADDFAGQAAEAPAGSPRAGRQVCQRRRARRGAALRPAGRAAGACRADPLGAGPGRLR